MYQYDILHLCCFMSAVHSKQTLQDEAPMVVYAEATPPEIKAVQLSPKIRNRIRAPNIRNRIRAYAKQNMMLYGVNIA